jgi:hypothetical protein
MPTDARHHDEVRAALLHGDDARDAYMQVAWFHAWIDVQVETLVTLVETNVAAAFAHRDAVARAIAATQRTLIEGAPLPFPVRTADGTLLDLLEALVGHDDSGCVFDHHGNCQEHNSFGVPGRCAVAEARAALTEHGRLNA